MTAAYGKLKESVLHHSSTHVCTEVYSFIVVIVSPLITLMKDQVWSMTERGMTALFVGESSEEMCVWEPVS